MKYELRVNRNLLAYNIWAGQLIFVGAVGRKNWYLKYLYTPYAQVYKKNPCICIRHASQCLEKIKHLYKFSNARDPT